MKNKMLLAAMIAAFIYACSGNQTKQENKKVDDINKPSELMIEAQGIFKPLPKIGENQNDVFIKGKIELGKILYMDTRLSKTGHNSCNSCHNLNTFGVDNASFSTGDAGKLGGRNSPSTFNAALHFSQFWDGRAKDVEQQAGMPVMNPVEMAIPSEQYLVKKLKNVPLYTNKFKSVFPNEKAPLTYKNIAKAIGAFERTLITPSKFDKYLEGDETALNEEEKNGLKTFINNGCTTCHNGTTIGGNQFMKFGLINDYRPLTGSKGKDNGLMDLTKKESDKDIFKVPSLRNIEKTYPYFHDGSVQELPKAIKIMAKAQLNKDLTDSEISSIMQFLKSLTSDIPEETKKMPVELSNKLSSN